MEPLEYTKSEVEKIKAEVRRDTVRRVIDKLYRRAYLDDDIWCEADVIREFADEISLDAEGWDKK